LQFPGTGSDYAAKIEELVVSGRQRFIVNLSDIKAYVVDRDISEDHFSLYATHPDHRPKKFFPRNRSSHLVRPEPRSLLREPNEYVPAFEQVIKAEIAEGKTQGRFPPDVVIHDEYFVGFDGAFGPCKFSPAAETQNSTISTDFNPSSNCRWSPCITAWAEHDTFAFVGARRWNCHENESGSTKTHHVCTLF
jgi:hypothetical protein